MKTIHIKASIKGDAATEAAVRACLANLGEISELCSETVDYKSTEGLTKLVWLYASMDDSTPYLLVADKGNTEGTEVTEYELQRLRSLGVCSEFYGVYPRSDRYGTPSFGNDDNEAAQVVAQHLLAVAERDFKVETEDRGDDGLPEFWFGILMPA